MQHRRVPENLLAPTATEPLREAERAPPGEHVAVEVQARRCPPAPAVRARRVDAARRARDARIDRDARAGRHRTLRSGFDDTAGDLVTEHERERAAQPEER